MEDGSFIQEQSEIHSFMSQKAAENQSASLMCDDDDHFSTDLMAQEAWAGEGEPRFSQTVELKQEFMLLENNKHNWSHSNAMILTSYNKKNKIHEVCFIIITVSKIIHELLSGF